MPKVEDFLVDEQKKQPQSVPKKKVKVEISEVLEEEEAKVKFESTTRRPVEGLKSQLEKHYVIRVLKGRFPNTYELFLDVIMEWKNEGQFERIDFKPTMLRSLVISVLSEAYRLEKTYVPDEVRSEVQNKMRFLLRVLNKRPSLRPKKERDHGSR